MSPSNTGAADQAQVVHIADLPKNRNEVLRIAFAPFKGEQYLNIRTWYRDSNGELMPTRKGFVVHVEKLDEFSEALDKAFAVAKEQGWLR
jgi:hypothetical protein